MGGELGMLDGLLSPDSDVGKLMKHCGFLGPSEVPEALLERERAARAGDASRP